MPIKRHKRQLANGEERVYLYAVSKDGTQRRSLSSAPASSVSPPLYRSTEKNRIVAALQANSSLLVVGEAGIGKSVLGEAVAEELQELGFTVAIAHPLTVKQALSDIANQLGVDTETLEGKSLTSAQLSAAIAEWLQDNTAFLICDDAHRYAIQFRIWLAQLHEQRQPLLLLATFPPARDIFLRLPRIELKQLADRPIRQIMRTAAQSLGVEMMPSQLAKLQQRCGGNPMLAQRVVMEEYLGLDATNPDHTQWIDGTPFLIAALMILVIIRFIGLGLNSTSLYLIGGILTIAVGVIRLLVYSLPRKSGKLGQ
ncbi:MAG: ATP-binding protein [Thermosynechococcaceae cyanobacterium]